MCPHIDILGNTERLTNVFLLYAQKIVFFGRNFHEKISSLGQKMEIVVFFYSQCIIFEYILNIFKHASFTCPERLDILKTLLQKFLL